MPPPPACKQTLTSAAMKNSSLVVVQFYYVLIEAAVHVKLIGRLVTRTLLDLVQTTVTMFRSILAEMNREYI